MSDFNYSLEKAVTIFTELAHLCSQVHCWQWLTFSSLGTAKCLSTVHWFPFSSHKGVGSGEEKGRKKSQQLCQH